MLSNRPYSNEYNKHTWNNYYLLHVYPPCDVSIGQTSLQDALDLSSKVFINHD